MSHITVLSCLCSITYLTSRNQRHARTRTEHRSSPAWLSKHSLLACFIRYSSSRSEGSREIQNSSANQFSVSKRVYYSLAKLIVLDALIHSVHLPPITPSFSTTRLFTIYSSPPTAVSKQGTHLELPSLGDLVLPIVVDTIILLIHN